MLNLIEQGVELLLGMPAGEDLLAQDDSDSDTSAHRYAEHTVYGRIERRLARLRRLRRAQNEPITLK